jgi:hypothetical protein
MHFTSLLFLFLGISLAESVVTTSTSSIMTLLNPMEIGAIVTFKGSDANATTYERICQNTSSYSQLCMFASCR